MTLVLDTDIIIDLENKNERITGEIRKLSEIYASPASITFVTYLEYVYGLRNKSPKNKAKAIMFIEIFHFITPTKKTAEMISNLRNKYEKSGKSFSFADLFIASQTIENNMILVTRDKKYGDMEELEKIIL